MSSEAEGEGVRVSPDLVSALHKKVKTLEDRVEQQDEQIAELKNQLSAEGSPAEASSDSTGIDSRDQSVIEQLDEGDQLTVSSLKRLYRTYTDVRSKTTLKSRVRSLTDRPEFVTAGTGRWVYNPERGESDE